MPTSIHTRLGGPGAIVPNSWVAFTIDDSASMAENTVAVSFSVTTAGNVVFVDAQGNAAITRQFPVGYYECVGQWLRVKSTGTTAVLSPANTVHVGSFVPV